MPVVPYASVNVTCQKFVNDARRYLLANQVQELNRVNVDNSIPAGGGDVSFDVAYPLGSMAQRGCQLGIELEELRVWETSGQTLTVVERGLNGSQAAGHAAKTMIEVNPKFSQWAVFNAINDDLYDLASPDAGLFVVREMEITYNPAVSGYDLTDANTSIPIVPSDVLAIQEVRYKIPGPTRHLPAIRNFQIARNLPTSDYPSGMALLLEGETGYPGLPLHVQYRSRFQPFVALTDDAQTAALLPPEANSLPALGAAIALMAGREIKRNFTEATSDPLQLELVTGGQVLNSYKGLMLLRQERIQRVKAGLLKQYGMPLRVV